jgi:hypothetical protein
MIDLYLNGDDPPGGYLLVRTNAEERWPILDTHFSGSRDGDFTYVFRVLDKQSRLRYFAVLGVGYGTGGLRFRAFEGYLIIPSEAGAINRRPPIYPVDFGYHWPDPPRFISRLESLRQESGALDRELQRLRGLRSRLKELQQQRETLAASEVPAEQEAKRQEDLSSLDAQMDQADREREALTTEMASRLERIYRTRAEMAEDWTAFREANPYRWMTPAERVAMFQQLEGSGALRAGWREAHAAVEGESKPPLRSAKQAMEQALLRELESRP